jgi:hypothetical protein
MKKRLIYRVLTIGLLIKVLLFIGISDTIVAQSHEKKITITGRVTFAGIYPVENAMILIDGQSTDKMTNRNGKYRIRVLNDAKKIGILSIGNGVIEEDISGRRINFILE